MVMLDLDLRLTEAEMDADALAAEMLDDEFWEQERDELRAVLLPLTVNAMLEGVDQGVNGLADRGLGLDVMSVTGQAVAYASKITDDLLDIIATSNRDGTGQIVARWIEAGEDLPSLLRRLKHAGIRNAELTGITEVTRAFSAGQRIAWDQSGFVEAREWWTVADGAVCSICRPLHGRVKPLHDRFTIVTTNEQGTEYETGKTVGSLVGRAGTELNVFGDPPAHPGCRCVMYPIIVDMAGLPPGLDQPAGESWTQASTIEEATEWAQRNYPRIDWNFKGVDLRLANDTLQAFDRMARDWPDALSYVRRVGTHVFLERMQQLMEQEARGERVFEGMTAAKLQNTYAFVQTVGNERHIALNPQYYGDPEALQRSLDYAVETGWLHKGSDSVGSLMAHEFGHVVDHWYYELVRDSSFLPIVDIQGRGLISEIRASMFEGVNVTSELSRYARTNLGEAWAEAFSARYYGMGRTPTEFEKRINMWMDFASNTRDTWYGKGEWKWIDEIADRDERVRAHETIQKQWDELSRSLDIKLRGATP